MSKKPTLSIVEADDRASKRIEAAAEDVAAVFVDTFEHLAAKCESPIERLLFAELFAYAKVIGYPDLHFCGTDAPPPEPAFREAAFVYQQAQIGRYRVDFLIHDATLPAELGPARWMVVECDGHDFHERTKEQARRDKQRDRFFQSKGYRVLRFTGSEIWADPEACVDEIVNQLACNDCWEGRTR